MSDFDAHAYVRASAAQTASTRRLIDSLTLRGDETLLDLGCGDGRVTAELAKRVPDGLVIGIDSSPAMIAAANDRRAANLSFRQLDITSSTTANSRT
jgi:trans-aconitate methyltransferase